MGADHDGGDGEAEAAGPDETEASETEIRLALVMNGGVSLAVWMGGVVHELDLLRRASIGDEDGVAVSDLKAFGIWRRLARDARRRVQIDIVAGTSAGGLNGLLLATALGRGAHLPSLKQMWIESASLNTLLPRESDAEEGGRGVLSGRKFEDAISAALDRIGAGRARGAQEEPVTLFVTATALDGKPRDFQDTYGHPFNVRDHRRVYRFHDEPEVIEYVKVGDRQWDFRVRPSHEFGDAGAEQVLVRAARATASFPAAFPPVSEDPLVGYRVRPASLETASCVMDGGVLNNAPFGPVLDEITRRRLDRPVDRVLVFIVPSRGRLADEKVAGLRCAEIPPATVAVNGLNYPQEADFRSGTEDLSHRLQTSVRGTREDLFNRIVAGCGTDRNVLEQQVRAAAANLLEEYRRTRVNAMLLDTITEVGGADVATLLGPPAEIDASTIDTVLGLDNPWLPTDDPDQFDSPYHEDWSWGINAATRLLAMLADHLHERVLPPDPCVIPPLHQEQRRMLEGASRINDGLRKALAVRDAFYEERIRRGNGDLTQNVLEQVGVVNRVFEELEVRKALSTLIKDAARQFLDALRTGGPGEEEVVWTDVQLVNVCLAVEVLTRAFAPVSPIVDKLTPKFKFLRLGPDEMGPLFREDWSTELGDRKLYGIRYGHFGAFIDDDWRRSDFTWGRLDAAHFLLPLLVPEDANAEKEIELHTAILAAETEDPAGVRSQTDVERMRDRLYELSKQSDNNLIDDSSKKNALLRAGNSAIDNLISTGRATRTVAHWFWYLTLTVWLRTGRRRSRRLRRQSSLGDAAIAMMKVLLVLISVCILAVVAFTVLVLLNVIP